MQDFLQNILCFLFKSQFQIAEYYITSGLK